MPVNDFITIQNVATFGGAVGLTYSAVQILKGLKFLKDFPTKHLSIIFGIFHIIIISFMLGNFNLSQLYLLIINGTYIGLTASAIHDHPNNKKNKKDINSLDSVYIPKYDIPHDLVENVNSIDNLHIDTDTREFDNLINTDILNKEKIQNNLIKENEDINKNK